MKKRILELRALPNLKGMTEELEETRAEMSKMIDDLEKDEKRACFSVEEFEKFNKLQERANELTNKIAEINSEREKEINSNQMEFRSIKDSVLPGEKIEKRGYKDKSDSMDFGKLVKGMSGRGWQGAEQEHEHFRAMQSADNSVLIPQALADRIIDVARTQSAVFGKIPIMTMQNNNLTIAVQTEDAVASFVNEGDLIPETKAIFKSVTLTGKTLAIFIPLSEQLLDTATNLQNQLMMSCSQAIGLALDKAMLYGAGEVEGSTSEIKGISLYSDINKETYKSTSVDYDLLIKGVKLCKNNNILPDNIVLNTNMSSDLSMLKDKNGQYIAPPKILENYIISESNNIKDNESYIFNSNYLVMGLQQGIKMEFGTTTDMFQRIQKGLRIYLRADLGVLNQKAVTQMKYELSA